MENFTKNKNKVLNLELERIKEKYSTIKDNLKNQVENSELLAQKLLMSQRGHKDFDAVELIVYKMGDSLLLK